MQKNTFQAILFLKSGNNPTFPQTGFQEAGKAGFPSCNIPIYT